MTLSQHKGTGNGDGNGGPSREAIWQWFARFVHVMIAGSIPWFVWATNSIQELKIQAIYKASREELNELKASSNAERHAMEGEIMDDLSAIRDRLQSDLSALREDMREIKTRVGNHNPGTP
jgi:hypothetical protein